MTCEEKETLLITRSLIPAAVYSNLRFCFIWSLQTSTPTFTRSDFPDDSEERNDGSLAWKLLDDFIKGEFPLTFGEALDSGAHYLSQQMSNNLCSSIPFWEINTPLIYSNV